MYTPPKPSVHCTPLSPQENLLILFAMLLTLSGLVMIGAGITSLIRCLGAGQHGFQAGAGLAGWICFGAFIAVLVFTAGVLATLPPEEAPSRRLSASARRPWPGLPGGE